VLAFASAAVVLIGRWPRLKQLGLAASAFVIAILPWQLWVASHDLSKEVDPGHAVDPGYLIDHADRIRPSLDSLYSQLFDESRWSFFVPLAIVAAVVALACRRAGAAAAFYLIAGAGAFLALLWSFWIAPAPVGFYATVTAFRIVGAPVAVSIAALIHLAPRLAEATPPSRCAGRDRSLARKAARWPR
jgi:hypothetical protein